MTGDDLRTWRESMHLSRRKLARALGVHLTTLSRWESGAIRVAHPLALAALLRELAKKKGKVRP